MDSFSGDGHPLSVNRTPPPPTGSDALQSQSHPPPFVRDAATGGWICPHCSLSPYHLRAPGSLYVGGGAGGRDPPPIEHLRQHYAICPGFSRQSYQQQQQQAQAQERGQFGQGQGQPPPLYTPPFPQHSSFHAAGAAVPGGEGWTSMPPFSMPTRVGHQGPRVDEQQQQHQRQQVIRRAEFDGSIDPSPYGFSDLASGRGLRQLQPLGQGDDLEADAAQHQGTRLSPGAGPVPPRSSHYPHQYDQQHSMQAQQQPSAHMSLMLQQSQFQQQSAGVLPQQQNFMMELQQSMLDQRQQHGGGVGLDVGLERRTQQQQLPLDFEREAKLDLVDRHHQQQIMAAAAAAQARYVGHQGAPPVDAVAAGMAAGMGGGAQHHRPLAADAEHIGRVHSAAAEFLAAETSRQTAGGGWDTIQDAIVLPEDRLLLTDYFYFLNQQLRICHFTEKDRKTRGGKRANLEIGYGGLECRHCGEGTEDEDDSGVPASPVRGTPKPRKFFWSDVDRLANSFAEISGHIMRCRKCPERVKAALRELKIRHPEQIAKLPRGSQKVFFRRMWRRLHPNSAEAKAAAAARGEGKEGSPPSAKSFPSQQEVDAPPARPPPLPPPPPEESGGGSPLDIGDSADSVLTVTGPARGDVRVLLAIADDGQWLSDLDCYVRKSLEVFGATEADARAAESDGRCRVRVGQVGVRCIHCSLASSSSGTDGAAVLTGPAVSYPYSISGIHETVREFYRLHLCGESGGCPNLPGGERSMIERLLTASSLPSVLRRYYLIAAKSLGMYDTPDGIRAEGGYIPGCGCGAGPPPSASSVSAAASAKGTGGGAAVAESLETSPQRSSKRSHPEVDVDSSEPKDMPVEAALRVGAHPQKKPTLESDPSQEE